MEVPIWLMLLYTAFLVVIGYMERRERKARERAEGRFEAARRGLLRVQETLGDGAKADLRLAGSQLRQAWQEIREIEE